MGPKTSRDLRDQPPRSDKAQEKRDVAAKEPDKTNDASRDLEHGDGGDIGLPTKPSDISRDD